MLRWPQKAEVSTNSAGVQFPPILLGRYLEALEKSYDQKWIELLTGRDARLLHHPHLHWTDEAGRHQS